MAPRTTNSENPVQSNKMQKAAFAIYLIVLIVTILLFGGVHTYAYTLMTLGVLTATVLVLIKNIRKDYKSGTFQLKFQKTGFNIVFVFLLAFLFIQITFIPDSILEFLSPEADVVGEMSLPARDALNPDPTGKPLFALAPYAYPVRMSILRFTVYGLFFFGFIRTLRSQKRINLAISLILITGCFEALYGLIQTYSGSAQIWWFKSISDDERLSGTYINSNHFAGFMGMGVLLAAAFAASLSPRRKRERRDSANKRSFRAKLSEALSREQAFTKRVLIVFSGVVLGIGLIFSASRGGMISVAWGMLLMGLLLAFRKGYRRKGFVLLTLFLLIAVYAFKIGVEYPVGRFLNMAPAVESRTRNAKKTMEIFKDYKPAGVGVGNFQYAYPKYQAVEDKKGFFRYAHNDWAQYLAEAGIAGMALMLFGVCYFVFRTLRLWAKRKDPFAVCLGVLPLAVLAAMGLHEYSDFNLHIPANFLLLTAVMAVGYAALHLERHRRRDVMNYRYVTLPMRYRGLAVLVLAFGLIAWTGWWTVRHFVAEAWCSTVPNSTMNRDPNPPVEEIEKAIAWDPWNAAYWYKLAERQRSDPASQSYAAARVGEVPTSDTRLPAVRALEAAVRLNPFEAQYHLRLGWEYAHLWQEPDYHVKWLPAADVSMDRCAYFAGVKNPRLHVEMGNYWTMRSKSVLPNNPVHESAWEKACRHYRKAMEIERHGQSGESRALKGMRKEIRDYVWNFYPDETYIRQAGARERSRGQWKILR